MTAVLTRRSATRILREAEARLIPGAAVVHSIRAGEPALERLARPEMQHALEDLGGRVEGAAKLVGSPLVETRLRQEDGEYDKHRIDSIIAASNIPDWKANVLRPMFEKQWQRTARMVIAAVERNDIKPTQTDAIVRNILEKGGTRVGLVDIDGDTRRALLKVVEVGRSLGMSPRKVASLIQHFVPAGRFTLAGKQYRSQMIARTEVLSAAREASLQSYKFSRTVEKVIAFDGEEFDETCASRNGEFFSIEQAEMENGDTHPNCVLAWGPA
jgi:hypothetical protein